MLPLLLALSNAYATPDWTYPQRSWTVSVDPLTLALGFTHLQVERVVGPHWSVYGSPHLFVFPSPLLAELQQPFRGLGAEAGVRYFFDDHAPTGCWVMARGVLAHLKTTEGADTPGLTSAGGYGSVLVGYTAILGEHLVLSGGAGAQYLRYQVDGMGVLGPAPALHTNVGWAF